MRRPVMYARSLLAGAVVGAAVLVGLSGAGPAGAQAAHLPAFYSVPAGITAKAPGSLVRYQRLAADGLHGTAYRVMYVSTDEKGKPAAVTGVLLVPSTAPPAGGYPVVAWAHGTDGMALQCAPSLAPFSTDLNQSIANQLLDRGWVVAASDYQGQGTPPGLLPYLVGDLAARNTVDIVRAARHLPAAHTSPQYVVWGHSEGGQTAMFAWKLGPTYGAQSGLHLDGVVAGAPPSQFGYIYDALLTSPYRFYLFMAAAGYHQAYGAAAPLDQVLTATGMKLLPDLKKGCFGYLQHTFDNYTLAQLVKANPFDVPAWKTLLTMNDPASFTTANQIPLLIPQGGADEQIPVVSTQLLAQHLCALGQPLSRWVYPGQSHAGVVAVYAGDMITWITERFAGTALPAPFTPTDAGVQVTNCPA